MIDKSTLNEKSSEVPLVPSVPDLEETPEIPAQEAVEARPATATQKAQEAQPATPRISARGGWKNIPWGTTGLLVLVAIVSFIGGWAWKDDSLLEFITSKFFFVVPTGVGTLLYWWVLRWMSMSTQVPWSEVHDGLKKGNMAIGVYFGARILSVGIVVGACILAGTSI